MEKGIRTADHTTCTICGGPLSSRQTKFCSPECRDTGARQRANTQYRAELFCLHCQKKLTGRQTKFCSKTCRIDFYSAAYDALIASGEKECSSCRETKPLEDFHPRKDTADRLYADCKKCIVQANGERASVKPDTRRAYNLKVNYNITIEEYDAILASQNGKCAVCKRPPRGKKLAVDHDHITKEVRGLLCAGCNLRVIGKHRSSDIFRSAANYIDNPPAKSIVGNREVPGSRPIDKMRKKRYRSRSERTVGRKRPA